MTKFGQVTAFDPDSGMATIRYARPEACEKCGGCNSASHSGAITLKASCAPGEWVRVEFPEGRFLQAAALAYGLPLGTLLGGLVVGAWLGGGQDGWTLLGGALGLGLGLLFLIGNERRIRGRQDWSPRVTQVYPEKPTWDFIGCEGEGLS